MFEHEILRHEQATQPRRDHELSTAFQPHRLNDIPRPKTRPSPPRLAAFFFSFSGVLLVLDNDVRPRWVLAVNVDEATGNMHVPPPERLAARNLPAHLPFQPSVVVGLVPRRRALVPPFLASSLRPSERGVERRGLALLPAQNPARVRVPLSLDRRAFRSTRPHHHGNV
eukprot:31106-Pelagococcus_subviridis.AAC.2